MLYTLWKLYDFIFGMNNRCVQIAIVVDVVIFFCVEHLVDVPILLTAILIDVLLVTLSITAISKQSAALLLPNMMIKAVLLLVLMFIGGLLSQVQNAPLMPHERHRVREQSTLTELARLHPNLAVWLAIFILLVVIEVRLLFGVWYRIRFPPDTNTLEALAKQPPPYIYCLAHGVNIDAGLPSYDTAIRIQKACCSHDVLFADINSTQGSRMNEVDRKLDIDRSV